jgi:hypothetical protein
MPSQMGRSDPTPIAPRTGEPEAERLAHAYELVAQGAPSSALIALFGDN